MSTRLVISGYVLICGVYAGCTFPAGAAEQQNDATPASGRVQEKLDAQPAAGGLAEGWKQDVEVPDFKGKDGNVALHGAKVTLWVEQGWLIARRETLQGNLEWQMVLARATDPQPPVIEAGPTKCNIRYGSYFIRDFLGNLRVYRERKTKDSPPWPAPEIEAKDGSWGSTGDLVVKSWRIGDWRWLSCGLSDNRNDVCVRVANENLVDFTTGSGFATTFGIINHHYGEYRFQDEGDLFVGQRSTADEAEVQAALRQKKIRAELTGKAAPELNIKQWLNAPADSCLKQYEGKVVLLDFWGTWCGACAQALPHSEELHQKYKDRGLVVIGVHSEQESDEVATFLKEKNITFPIAVDNGDTAKNYAVEAWPTYFLIDKTGKVRWGFSSGPPTEKQIEDLLQ